MCEVQHPVLLEDHLNAVHGRRLNDLMGMNRGELEELHAKLHEPDPTLPIEPRTFMVQHHRMGSTVNVGPFYTLSAAQEYIGRHGLGTVIIGMLHPIDTVDCDGNLRQEVWN